MLEGKFSVAIIRDYGFGEDTIPVAVEIDYATANSIRRHYKREFKNAWSDYDQTGLYVTSVSTTYCKNHQDFERLSIEYPSLIPDNIFEAFCKGDKL